jgi:tetratricopeptide (TPR) repeat protein
MKRFYPFLLVLIIGVWGCSGAAVIRSYPDQTISDAHKIARTGMGQYNLGCYNSALKLFTSAHELFTLADDLPGVALCLNNMGGIYRHLDDTQSALSFFKEAFRLYQRIGDTTGACQALCNQAAVLTQQDQLDNAQSLLDKAQKLAAGQPGTNSKTLIPILTNQGILMVRQEKFDTAENTLKQALALIPPEETSSLATANAALGNLMKTTNRFEQALAFFQVAYENDLERGAHHDVADDLAAMGECCLALNRIPQGVGYLQRGIKMFALIGEKDNALAYYEHLVQLSEKESAENIPDMTLLSHFVNQWLSGDILVNRCR